ATLADVFVLLAFHQHEQQALPHRHRLLAAGTMEEAGLERSISCGLARAARRTTEHGAMVSPSASFSQSLSGALAGRSGGRYDAARAERVRGNLRLPDERG